MHSGEIKISLLTAERVSRQGEVVRFIPKNYNPRFRRIAHPVPQIRLCRWSSVCQDLIYDEISTRLVLKSIMNERNELHVRLAFSRYEYSRFPLWDYKGRVRKLISSELPRSRWPATSLKRTALRLDVNYHLHEP